MFLRNIRCLHGGSMSRHLHTNITCVNGTHSGPYQRTHDAVITRIISSKADWLILYRHTKLLSEHRSEITKERCTIILLSLLQILREQNVLKDSEQCEFTGYIYDRGSVYKAGSRPTLPPSEIVLRSSSLVRYLKFTARIRPYYRLERYWSQESIQKEGPHPGSNDIGASRDAYDDLFGNLVRETSPLLHRKHNKAFPESKIGPLRGEFYQLSAIPPLLTNPFYFELKVNATPNALEHPKNIKELIDTCCVQLMDHLLSVFGGEDDCNRLCLVAMFIATCLYGPKLRSGLNPTIDAGYEKFHSAISARVTSTGCNVSFRSLAYLLNSCFNGTETLKLSEIAANRLLNASSVVPLDYLENICFALSRAGFQHDDLYQHIAMMVKDQVGDISPTVCLNLLRSYHKLGLQHMIAEPLEKKLGEYTEEHFQALKQSFLHSSYQELKDNLSMQSLNNLREHIEGKLTEVGS